MMEPSAAWPANHRPSNPAAARVSPTSLVLGLGLDASRTGFPPGTRPPSWMARRRYRIAKSSASRLIGRNRFTRPGISASSAPFSATQVAKAAFARPGRASRVGLCRVSGRTRNATATLSGRLAGLVELTRSTGDQFGAEGRVEIPRLFGRPIGPCKIPARLSHRRTPPARPREAFRNRDASLCEDPRRGCGRSRRSGNARSVP